MKMKSVCALVTMVSFSSVSAANTWYVDDDNYGKSGMDGKSVATAYGTIQDAIDAADTKAGDTILVEPGVYSNGTTVANTFKGTNYPVRVYLRKPNLTIRSTGGRAVTHIVGERGSGTGGFGPGAAGCVYSPQYTTENAGFVLQGFTIRDGYSPSTSSSDFGGTGVRAINKNDIGSTVSRFHVIDCAITNCSSALAAAYKVTLHRCLVAFNAAASSTDAANLYDSQAENSIIGFNRRNHSVYTVRFVNCTLVGSGGYVGRDGGSYANCVLALNAYNRDVQNAKSFANSVTTDAESGFPGAVDSTFSAEPTSIFLAPLFGDYRLVAGSPAIARGNPAHLATFPCPEGYVWRDYAGNPIDMNAATCAAGAYQTVVTPEGGCTSFGDDVTLVDGYARWNASANYAWAETWPKQWCITSRDQEASPLSCVSDSLAKVVGSSTWYLGKRFAGLDGQIWVTAAPAGTNRTYTAEVGEVFRYVDPENGNDAWNGEAATRGAGNVGPWRTLQNAVTNANNSGSKRTIVYCAEGTYAEGSSGSCRVKVDKGRYHFVGLKGAEKTFIVGEAGANANGTGDGAMFCVDNQCNDTGFTGFTFTGGHAPTDQDKATITSEKYGIGVTDSVFSNNVTWAGKYLMRGQITLERCLITGNSGILLYGQHYSSEYLVPVVAIGCRIIGNASSGDNTLVNRARLVNCTIVDGDGTASRNYVNGSLVKMSNCILSGLSVGTLGGMSGCLLDNCTGSGTGTIGPAYLVDDLRPFSGSAAFGAAVLGGEEFWRFVGGDGDGLPVCRAGAPTVAGAYTVPVANGVVISDPSALVASVEPVAEGRYLVPDGGSILLSANEASKRPVVGVAMNGVTNLFESATHGVTLTYDEVTAQGGVTVKPVFGNVWYVNAGEDNAGWEPGSDEQSGFAKFAPLFTLRAAAKKAQAGDVILAAPGCYSNGTMKAEIPDSAANAVQSRVEVAPHVTLRSAEGAARTFIVGAPDPDAEEDAVGCGANAVRCVFLGQYASVEGFTLTDGHSLANKDNGWSRQGAAVARNSNSGMGPAQVVDCVISNCTGWVGLIYAVDVIRCQIVNNLARIAYIVSSSQLYNTLVARNRMMNKKADGSWATGDSAYMVTSCSGSNITFLNDNVSDNPSMTGSFFEGKSICNSILDLNTGGTYTNCIIKVMPGGMCVNCWRFNDETCKLVNHRPVIGLSHAVDRGSNAVYPAAKAGDTDLDGKLRIMNGAIDIGAFEADWRPNYSARLGRNVTVTDVSAACVTNTAGGVSLGSDGTLALDWALGGQDGQVIFDVTGSGTLTVSRNGAVEATFDSSSDPKSYDFRPEDASVQHLVFSFTSDDGTGSAAILRCKRRLGLLLIVR